jgi:hypothetical protein
MSMRRWASAYSETDAHNWGGSKRANLTTVVRRDPGSGAVTERDRQATEAAVGKDCTDCVERSHAARARVFWQIRAPRVRPPATRTRSRAQNRRDGWGDFWGSVRAVRGMCHGEVQRAARPSVRVRVTYSQEICFLEPSQARRVLLHELASKTPNNYDDTQTLCTFLLTQHVPMVHPKPEAESLAARQPDIG